MILRRAAAAAGVLLLLVLALVAGLRPVGDGVVDCGSVLRPAAPVGATEAVRFVYSDTCARWRAGHRSATLALGGTAVLLAVAGVAVEVRLQRRRPPAHPEG